MWSSPCIHKGFKEYTKFSQFTMLFAFHHSALAVSIRLPRAASMSSSISFLHSPQGLCSQANVRNSLSFSRMVPTPSRTAFFLVGAFSSGRTFPPLFLFTLPLARAGPSTSSRTARPGYRSDRCESFVLFSSYLVWQCPARCPFVATTSLQHPIFMVIPDSLTPTQRKQTLSGK